jgi:hypothetical protein
MTCRTVPKPTEPEFRYSNRGALGINDAARAARALEGIVGKRLTYWESFA